MSCHVILDYKRSTGERVTITQHPGRLVVVDIDGDVVDETFLKPIIGSVETAALDFARKWKKSDFDKAAELRRQS